MGLFSKRKDRLQRELKEDQRLDALGEEVHQIIEEANELSHRLEERASKNTWTAGWLEIAKGLGE